MGLSRYVDRQTAGVLRIASFLCYGSQAELDFIVIPTSSVYGNASESVLWVWWFRISLPWGILPATVPCSVAVRPEELVISYVAFFIRLWTVISWLLFLPRWRFMFYFLNRSWRRYLVPRRLLPGKAFVFYSPVSAWGPHLGSLSPRVEMAQIMQSLSFTLLSRRPLLLWAAHSASPFSPSQSRGERKDSEAATANFKTQKKGKFRTIY